VTSREKYKQRKQIGKALNPLTACYVMAHEGKSQLDSTYRNYVPTVLIVFITLNRSEHINLTWVLRYFCPKFGVEKRHKRVKAT